MHSLTGIRRVKTADELQVYLPPPAQLISAVGDRYLAANIDVIRTFMVGIYPMDKGSYMILGRLHTDAALLNPGHEDNYYVAAAILPWVGHVKETQYVLKQAMKVRPYDYLPPLFYAFHQRHFEKNAAGGIATLREAANYIKGEQNRVAMRALAAQWAERADGSAAATLLRALASEARNPAFAEYLLKRARRLEAIGEIERAVKIWQEHHVSPPPNISLLVKTGLLAKEPEDPFGGTFTITATGAVEAIEKQEVK